MLPANYEAQAAKSTYKGLLGDESTCPRALMQTSSCGPRAEKNATECYDKTLNSSALSTANRQTVEAHFCSPRHARQCWRFCLRTNGLEQQNSFQRRARTNRCSDCKSSGWVRRDWKSCCPHRQTREATSSNGFCHLMHTCTTKQNPKLLCTANKQTVDAHFFSPRPARLCWRFRLRTRTSHPPRAIAPSRSAVA